MPQAVVAKLRFGPDTFNAAAAATGTAQIIGGRLVQFSATDTGKVILAADNSDVYLGVALYDAHPSQNGSAATPSGFDGFDFSTIQPEVAVAWTGVFKLDFAEAANTGDLVYAAADGKVKKTKGTATRAVGMVVQKSNVLVNTSGYVRLF